MHILNWCKTSLDQGRFTWRHNSILSQFIKIIKEKQPDTLQIYADLQGHNFNGGTVPPNILPTAEKPDVVIVNQSLKEITILELTCSYETNIESANTYKSTKYNDLKKDLEKAGWKTKLIPFEIGSRGLVTKRNKTTISKALKEVKIKINLKKLFIDLSKIALLCSYSIYQAHGQQTWQDPPYLTP